MLKSVASVNVASVIPSTKAKKGKSNMEEQMGNPVFEEWYYEDDGTRTGPVTETVMKEAILSGKLVHGNMVWKKGFSDWVKIEESNFKSFLQERAVPPPLVGDKVNNTVVWILAFAPVIGAVLEGFLAALIYKNEYSVEVAISSNQFWYVTLILNIVLSYMDEKRLRAAGHDTEKFKGFFWLIPVYLFQRAKNLKQNLAYFIVWMICFVIMLLG